jgi:hypothetical protein
MKDGERQYVTFRNGGKIVATGRSAFLLARTDNKKHSKPQERDEPIPGKKQKKSVDEGDMKTER